MMIKWLDFHFDIENEVQEVLERCQTKTFTMFEKSSEMYLRLVFFSPKMDKIESVDSSVDFTHKIECSKNETFCSYFQTLCLSTIKVNMTLNLTVFENNSKSLVC